MSDLPSTGQIVFIVLAGLVAGFVNTVAGGGSLLALPALMFAGLPASVANGTNRVAILVQSLVAATSFHRAGKLPWRALEALILPTLAGAGVGAGLAAVLPGEVLQPALLVILVGMAVLLVARPELVAPASPTGDGSEARALGAKDQLALFGAGIYGGFVQAGVGFVFLAVLAGGLRFDLVRANALKVALVLVYTVVVLGIFLAADLVRWVPGLILAASSVAGARLGVRLSVERADLLRWVLLVAVIGSAAVLLLR